MDIKYKKIQFYLVEDLKIALEEYIVEKDLDRLNVTINNLSRSIVLDWLENPILDIEKIFYKYTWGKKERRKLITIFLKDEEKIIDIKRKYVKDYIRKIQSPNMLVANIIHQWAIKNIEGYGEDEN